MAVAVDASVKACGTMAGCGGVIRDHLGNFVSSFARRLEQSFVLEAELWALYHRLCLAWGKG